MDIHYKFRYKIKQKLKFKTAFSSFSPQNSVHSFISFQIFQRCSVPIILDTCSHQWYVVRLQTRPCSICIIVLIYNYQRKFPKINILMRYFARFSIRYRNIRIRIFLFLLSENETCDNSGLINYPVGTQKLHLHFRRIRIYLYYIIHGGKNETNILFTLKFKI